MLIYTLIAFSAVQNVYAQKSNDFRVLFWNVENLFDCNNDSLKEDDEFLPASIRVWHYGRYKKKLRDVAKVICAAGGWRPPALIGMCEIENDTVMRDLTRYSPLKELGYRYVMTCSPDQRGIDVALLYQRDRFRLLTYHSIRVSHPALKYRPTRDILHVTGLIATGDSIDVFVCHFPSRSQGVRETNPYRKYVAEKLRSYIDSLSRHRIIPRILIMGDLNMYKHDRILKETLRIQEVAGKPDMYKLYWPPEDTARKSPQGTYKYKGKWEKIDHLIVSGALLDRSLDFRIQASGIIDFPFLLNEDEKYGGSQPYRTYYGMKYQGGISDHLPVYADFKTE